MQQHIKILSIVFYIFGALGLLGALFMLLGGAGLATMIAAQDTGGDAAGAFAAGGCMTGVAVLIALLSLPTILAGWGLSKRKSWARILTIIIAILNLPGFPLGTALGVYALWVMFNDETKALLTE
ncbi:MAG TPA: hypothetical protein VGF48_20325 [Thermoanaerobaculia bacterium]|jgi:hypothetical protein